VRLISGGGRDWADRFSLIVSAAPELPEMRFVIDGEVGILNEDWWYRPPVYFLRCSTPEPR
jgi:ATP-dependent DNA ligase